MEHNEKLRALQLCELDILRAFAGVCERLGLRYYLVGGTLLGAVRHGGFIPWDDDIDVAMPREDYDRFARIAQAELGPDYFYQSPDTDPHYFLTYAKIRKKGTFFYEERFRDARFEQGVFIDIFPLDFCPPRGPVCHLLFNTLAVMNYRGQVDSGEPYRPYKELSGKLGYAFLRLYSPRGLVRARRRLLRLSRRLSNGKTLASYAGAYSYRREVSPWDWFRDTTEVEFEGRKYVGPKGYDGILTQSYGRNYMDIPPAEKQVWHTDIEKCRF